MRAICIDDKYESADGTEPVFGEIVTIQSQCEIYPDAWNLVEHLLDANGDPQSFKKRRFALLSNIDELELAEQREDQFATI